MPKPSIVWFRQDLRLEDNPALVAAAARGGPIIPVFIWAPEEDGAWPPGAASRWWLHHSLQGLEKSLKQRKLQLVIRRGPPDKAFDELIRKTGATAVFWNRRFEPVGRACDTAIKSFLKARSIQAESCHANLLFEPWAIYRAASGSYQVFTPFWRKCLSQPEPAAPLPTPPRLVPPAAWPTSVPLYVLNLLPKIPWDSGLRAAWSPGETGAAAELQRFLKSSLADYSVERDRPSRVGTSRLSPHLHFGEIGPRQIWHAVRDFVRQKASRRTTELGEPYLRQLVWREFAFHLLFYHPHTPQSPLRQTFVEFPWRDDEAALRAWQRGQTGYPYIDAGMRELWHTGWMHNRVRMAVASFLVKDLLISWEEGARWFWDTLVDANLANNTLGWQWTAGCGADAAPFFRIFNPVTQGEKFDPHGNYVRRWVPELSRLPTKWLHKPWEAPADVLSVAGVKLGETYPHPIVDHAVARQRALAALAEMKQAWARNYPNGRAW
jgi:deoxyribodipyrimidine photo-lyase